MHSQDNPKTSKIVLCAILCGLSLVLSLVDSAVSIPFLPGIKLGIASIVSLYALYRLGLFYALVICVVRCVAASLLSGNLTMLAFSLAGGIASILIMALVKKRLSIIKTSVLGALTHNLMQGAVAVIITSTPQVSYYIPLLIITGAISGFCMGLICNILLSRIK